MDSTTLFHKALLACPTPIFKKQTRIANVEIGQSIAHYTQYKIVFFVGFRNSFIDEKKPTFPKLATRA
ncbi:MAG: hypothetical protein ACJAWV_001508 [Flammeovirgaceae bacterium]